MENSNPFWAGAHDPHDPTPEITMDIDAMRCYAMMAKFIVAWYGPRCPETDPECPKCAAWIAADRFLDTVIP
jgi:hypothetical protein